MGMPYASEKQRTDKEKRGRGRGREGRDGEQTKKLKKRGAYHEDVPLSFHLPYTHTRETCHEAIKIICVANT